jgi:hypothetical protein
MARIRAALLVVAIGAGFVVGGAQPRVDALPAHPGYWAYMYNFTYGPGNHGIVSVGPKGAAYMLFLQVEGCYVNQLKVPASSFAVNPKLKSASLNIDSPCGHISMVWTADGALTPTTVGASRTGSAQGYVGSRYLHTVPGSPDSNGVVGLSAV